MQLLNLLKKAQQEGPNEAPVTEEQLPKVKRENNAESKYEEYIAHEDSKNVPASNDVPDHMRIEEVDDENDHTRNSNNEDVYNNNDHDYSYTAAAAAGNGSPVQRHHRGNTHGVGSIHGGSPQRNFEMSPQRNHRDSKQSHYYQNQQQVVHRSLDSFVVNRSFDKGGGMQSPHQSSQGPACIFAPENVENQPPRDITSSLEDQEVSVSVEHLPPPQRLTQQPAPIQIYMDDINSPVVATSAYFPKLSDQVEEAKEMRRSPNKVSHHFHKQSAATEQIATKLQPQNSDYSNSSPQQNAKKRYSHRDSQRNYFRRDQDNKHLVSSLKKSGALVVQQSLESAALETEQNITQLQSTKAAETQIKAVNNASKLDQVFGVEAAEQMGSIHATSAEYKENLSEEGGAINAQQWHDVKVIQSDAGSQELIIENLDQLGESGALVITRDGQNFKIGIQQDHGVVSMGTASDIASQTRSNRLNSQQSSAFQKIKLRGKFGSNQTQQKPSKRPDAIGKRTASVNSQHERQASKQSGRSRITMPQITTNMMQQSNSNPNQFKTFQDPVVSTVQNKMSSESAGFRNRIRESASDNKRAKGSLHERSYDSNQLQPDGAMLELRSRVQRVQAEEMIRKSREINKQTMQISSPGQDSQYSRRQEAIGYVKVVESIKSIKGRGGNPNDRSDSKLGPADLQSNLIRKQSEDRAAIASASQGGGHQQYQKSTHNANSSVHSRDATFLNQLQLRTPEPVGTIKHSTISVRLNDQTAMMDQSNISQLQAMPHDQHQHLSQTVQAERKRDFQSLKKDFVGNRQAMAGLHGLQSFQGGGGLGGDQSKFIDVDVMSQEQMEEQQMIQRASIVSRRSNTDQKGEHLVKFDPKKTTIPEMKKEESPRRLESGMPTRAQQQLNDMATSALLGSNSADSQSAKPFGEINSISDKHVDDEEDQVVAAPQNGSSKQVNSPVAGASIQNHTDTAFYDRRVSNTESKQKKKARDVVNESPRTEKKQLSEIAPAEQQSQKPEGDQEELNYHTTTEDAGDAYFPQIVRYKENAPVESILSRDNYSTSAHPSMVSAPPKNQQAQQQPETEEVPVARAAAGNSSRVKKYFNKTGGSKGPTTGRESHASGALAAVAERQPRDIMNQNVVRQDAQYASAQAAGSILSNSVNEEEGEDDEKTDVNQRASSMGDGTETDGRGIHKDPSSYNIKPNEIAAIPNSPKQRSMKAKSPTVRSPKQSSKQSPKQSPRMSMKNSEAVPNLNIQEITAVADLAQSEQHTAPKEGSVRQSIIRSSHRSKLSKLSSTQRSKASLASKKANGLNDSARTQSLLPILNRQNDSERAPAPLKSSSNRMKKQFSVPPKKSDRSSGQPPSLLTASVKGKTMPYDQGIIGGPNINTNLIVATAGTEQQSAKLPQITSPNNVGQHLAQPSNRTVMSKNSPPSRSQLDKTMSSYKGVGAAPDGRSNGSMLDNMVHQQQQPTADGQKPITKYMEGSDAEQKSYPLKYFKGQDLELYYMERQLKPGVEQEIKEGFFEIRKKFGDGQASGGAGGSGTGEDEVQVYVSHLCLHNYHPIFCKFNLDVVKTILNFSQIIYLKKNQVLYQQGFNDRYLYVILFGKLRLSQPESDAPIGQPLNIGWTVGEEILFKSDRKANGGQRLERCRSLCESCVLGIEKRNLAQIKRTLVERGQAEEFVKLEVVLRGNYLVKKAWRN